MAPVDNRAERPLGGEQLTITHRGPGLHGRAAPTFRATDLLTNEPGGAGCPHPEIEADPVLSERFQREDDIDKALEHPA